MKSLAEFYNEICADEGLKEQLKEAAEANIIEDFFKEHGCEATADEVKDFIKSQKEVNLDELDSSAGGCTTDDSLLSGFTLGIGCAIVTAISASGTKIDGMSTDMC